MKLHGLVVVFQKELIDNLRDRRSMLLALIYPLIGAVLLGVLINLVGGMFKANRGEGAEAKVKNVHVLGAEYAPQVIKFLESRNYRILPAPKDPYKQVREGRLGTLIVFKSNFSQLFDGQKTARIDLVLNATRLTTILSVSELSKILRGHSGRISRARLQALNVDPQMATPFHVRTVNVGQGRSLAGFFLNMLPPFIIFTIFVGGVYLAIDTTAGERERGSLEPLLTNPVPRGQLMLGKALATFLFTMMSVVFQLIAFKVMFMIVAGGGNAMIINPPISIFLITFGICLPLIMFAVALQIIVATFSRSYKETQTYLALLPLIPSMPGMVMVFMPINVQGWMMFVPTFSQTLLIGKLMRDEPIELGYYFLGAGATAVIAALMLAFAAKLYNRENLLFGG